MRRESQGRAVFQQPRFAFQMLELGVSYVQKYNAVEGEFNPDRTLTPSVFVPQLTVIDPDGIIPEGLQPMVNASWTVSGRTNGTSWARGTHYQVDPATHRLTINANCDPHYAGLLAFHGEYFDHRTGKVSKFDWKRTISCETYADNRLSLHNEQSKVSLMPFKNRGQFDQNVQLFRGEDPAPDGQCVYRWRVWEDGAFRAISSDGHADLWYVSGADTKSIRVDQDYIQHVLLQCTAYLHDYPDETRTATVLLRRWYGQYDDDLVWLSGKYVFPDTPRAEAEVVVTRRTGMVADVMKYFDIEILYHKGTGQWQHVCHGCRGMVPRSMFPVDGTLTHRFGWILREKSAKTPLTVTVGASRFYLTAGGKVLTGRFPTTAREE